jgi:hypothetical protein
MPDLATKLSRRRRLKRAAKIAAVVGALAGAACQFLPPDYQDACKAVTKAASLSVGGC